MASDSTSSSRALRHEPIAVVGVSALFPGSATAGGFWRDILAGRDLVTDVPESHWLIEDYYDPDPKAPDKTYAKRGAFISPVDFDPVAYGIPPTIVEATDTSQLLALIVARQVLDDAAKGQFDEIDKSRISVILGVTSAQELLASMVSRLQRPVWTKALREGGLPEDEVKSLSDRIADHYVPWQESSFPGLLGNVVAGRIANRFNLGGTNCVTDAACASTFSAVSMAVNELRLGESDMVVAGGVDTLNDIFMYMCFSKTPALSPTGDCRPFSDKADGTLLGEGLGMVALKRLRDAEENNDRIYAVIRGVGSSSDGRAKSVYAPVSEGQSKALIRAYDQAGYGPESVELIEAHGTATKAGDVAEFKGLCLAFDADQENAEDKEKQWCALGSVKSQVGHTKAAAGAAGLFKVVMALHHKTLPPTIKVDHPNPALGVETSPFYLNTEARPWIRDAAGHPRRGSISSFGFGGSNFHVAVEEYQGENAAPRLRTAASELVVLHAETASALAELCEKTATEANEAGFLIWLAASSQKDFNNKAPHRLAIVAEDEEGLRQRLETAATQVRKDQPFATPNGIYYGNAQAETKTAFLFPGQGSQYVGMGGDLAMTFDAARESWDEAASLAWNGGRHLQDLVFPKPVFDDEARERQAEELTSTEWAQPAIGTVSLSQLALLRQLGVTPECVAGHSYGEVAALHAAGVFDAREMLQVSRKRGEAMHEASSIPGAMTAVVADLKTLQPLLEKWQEDVVVANHNSPEQVVLSGSVAAVESVEKRLADEGLNVRRLPVSTAFHSPVIAQAAAPFGEYLNGVKFNAPQIDVYANATAAPYEADNVRDRLAEQVGNPVLFVEMIDAMYERGVRTFIEVGPGSVLTKLVEKCLAGRPHRAVSLDRKSRNGVTQLWNALGQLSVDGLALDFSALWQGFEEPVDPRTTVKPKMKLAITGSNYGKVYPPPGGAAALPKPNPPRPEPEPIIEVREVIKEVHVPVAAPAAAQQPATPQPFAQPTAQQQPFAAQPVQAAPQAPVHQDWLLAFQETQRQTVDAFTSFQRSMADSQTSFFQAMEASYATLGQMAGAPAQPMSQAAAPMAAAPQPVMQQPVMPQPVMQQPVMPQAVAPAPVVTPAPVAPTPIATPEPVVTTPAPVAPTPAPVTPAPVVAEPAAPAVDLQAVMLEVVSEKTGYPVDMLELSMDMEADLGIDSIKRVEILSGVREQAPDLPEMDTGAMGALKTLQEIVDYMSEQLPEAPAASSAVASSAVGTAVASAPAAASVPAVDLQAIMLEVVSEKTGYPVDMLELSMDMEADLGIDSIKRVEILSGVREQAPDLPEMDTGAMGALKTLQEIVDHMSEQMPALASAPAAPAPSSAPVAPAVDLQAIMLDVVAEKTGYPADMLNLDMDMEADLGIDSIKRVEILSGVRERAPGLPEMDTGAMGALKTLQQIVDYMTDQAPTAAMQLPAATPAAMTPAANATAGSEAVDLQAIMLDVVAEKTGYPADMLNLDMDMEADLGIDSIKRVEILSGVREQAPGIPEVDTGAMGALKTLRQIVEFMSEPLASAESSSPVPESPVPQAPSPAEPAFVDSPTATTPSAAIGRFTLHAVEKPFAGLAMAGVANATKAAIVQGPSDVAQALADEIGRRGIQAEAVNDVPEDADMVIFLGGLDDVQSVDDAATINRRAFATARKVAERLTEKGGVFVTVQDTGGTFGLEGSLSSERAALGGLAGLAKTATLEWPEASVKAIDCERGERSAEDVAAALVQEIWTGGAEIEVGLRADGGRVTLVTERHEVDEDPAEDLVTINEQSVIVASGGARGVTAATLIALAEKTKARFVVLGRTELEDEPESCEGVADADVQKAILSAATSAGEKLTPKELQGRVSKILATREVRGTLNALQDAGSAARYVAANVQDRSSLTEALAKIRAAWGPITGIVHGAGVIADKKIAEKTDEQFDRVFDTKVSGLQALLAATEDDPLNMICLFSSVTARCGNVGQADYAMANEVLNKMAAAERQRRGKDCLAKSLNWGPWESGMVTPALKKHFESQGVPLIPLDTGAQMLVDELTAAGGNEIEIVLGGDPARGFEGDSAGSNDSVLRMDAWVHEETHPFLEDHSIQGAPVLPVVLALEWFNRLATLHCPNHHVAAVRGLRVLNGIRLDQFKAGGDAFQLESRQVSNGSGRELALRLSSRDGRPRYQATVEMAPTAPSAPAATRQVSNLDPWPEASIYGDVLFHGPDFQVIENLEGISDDGMAAALRGAEAMGWKKEWATDPALLDGGLQLAVLWFKRKLGGASLPMVIGSYHRYGKTPSGSVRAELRSRVEDSDRTIADIVFSDGDVLLAEMKDVQIYRRPDIKV